MTLCRFFQQGYCRYGNNCRFEHANPQYTNSVSPLLRTNNQPPPNVTAPKSTQGNNAFRTNKKDARDIFNLIVQDINESEKGGVWPLSSYNFWPLGAHGNVPGLEDLSPEEMRHLQMQAKAAGTLDACNQQIQQMYQQARARFNSLKVLTPETLAIIESMTRGPAQTSTASQFSFATGSSVAQDSWPAPAAASGSVFGGSAASAPSNSIFGGATATGPSGAAFGSVFGGTSNPGQSSIFGGASQFGAASISKPSFFGGTSTQTQPAAFAGASPMLAGGATASPFGVPQQSSIFGGATATQQPSSFVTSPTAQQPTPFGAAPTVGQSGGSIFGGAASATASNPNSFSFALPNAFGAGANSVQTAPFGGAVAPSTNVFGGAVQNNPQATGSIFGGMAATQGILNPPVQTTNISFNATLYSAITQLSEEEKREFEAETFSVGKIPCRPPPKELC